MSITWTKKDLMNKSLTAMTINIGKAGINHSVLAEIKRQLKAKEILKLRFAKNISYQKENYITQIVEMTNANLIDSRGNVAVIFKKKDN